MTARCWRCSGVSLLPRDPARWLGGLAALLLLGTSVVPARAQVTGRLALGASKSTRLLRDNVLDNTELTLGVAPTATAGLAFPLSRTGPYRVVFEGSYSRATLSVTDDSMTGRVELQKVGLIGVGMMLDGPLGRGLRWQAGAGVLWYRPSERQGVFAANAPTRYQLTGGLSWARPIRGPLSLLAMARYSFHEFTTASLVDRGYSSTEGIHRLGLQLGLERRF